MPRYFPGDVIESSGDGGLPPPVAGNDHAHSGWEAPIEIAARQMFGVRHGRYLQGELVVQIAVPGEVGYQEITPPLWAETDPIDGAFAFANELPAEWVLRVRYAYPLTQQEFDRHFHSGWETPWDVANRQVWRVNAGSFQPGELAIELSAEPDGEIGFEEITPPLWAETDPQTGTFTLTEPLPANWRIRARYVHR